MAATNHPYCRLCTLKSENYIDAFHNDGTALELAPKIKQCLQIFLTPEDVLPKTVCVNCCEKVLEFSDFFNMCSKSQICLIAIFTKENESQCDITQKELPQMDFNINLSANNENKVTENMNFSDELHKKIQCMQESTSLSQTNDERLLIPSEIKTTNNAEPSSILQNILEGQEEEGNCSSDEGDDSLQSLDLVAVEKCVWKCATCDLELNSLSSLKSHHINAHQQVPVYKCSHCFKVYEKYRSYSRHVKTHLFPNKFSCSICGTCFSQKTILQSHMAVHSEVRPHVCVFCGKSFKQFSSLYLHSKCHLPDKAKTKYPCTQCDKVFSSKPMLGSHTKIHTGEKNFICDICGKRFYAKNSLDYHISTHTDEKPYSCPTCGKCFRTRRLLTKHVSVHTGVKPHQCDVCGKTFRERSALREHSRIHTGAMPYSCEFCGKLFRFKGILTVHRRLHTGERPYSCQVCHREFTNWANYNKHMKRRHSQMIPKQRIAEQPPQPVESSTILESTQNFDPDIAVLVANQQYLQAESHNLLRVSQYPSNSLQLSSYYIPTTHSAISPDH